MANIKFYLWNHFAYKPEGRLLSSSDLDIDHKVDNLRVQARREVWRSAGVVGEWIQRDFGAGETVTIGAVGLVDPNFSVGASFRIRVSDNPDMSAPSIDLVGLAPDFLIYSADEMVEGKNSEFFPGGFASTPTQAKIQSKVILVDFDIPVKGRYFQLDIDDAANPDGYIQIAYLFAGITFTPEYGIIYNWQRERLETARSSRATNGQYWLKSVLKRITISATIELQSHVDTMNIWALFLTLLGNRREIIVKLFDKNDFSNSMQFFSTIFCRFLSVPRMSNDNFERYNIPFEVEELL